MKIKYWTVKNLLNNNKKGKVFNTMNTQVRSTSKEAYKDIINSGKRYTQTKRVLNCIMDLSSWNTTDWTLREIATMLDIEMNSISARVNELKKRGVVIESPKRICKISKKVVIPVKLANAD